ncbi:hypothetical protein FVER14953_20246 [Fusarium verticillioides]|nr:hypothetical protein FVER14953_20246 [Fusarium verticillioides]
MRRWAAKTAEKGQVLANSDVNGIAESKETILPQSQISLPTTLAELRELYPGHLSEQDAGHVYPDVSKSYFRIDTSKSGGQIY